MAYGGVSALLFYRALADHLGRPFVQSGVCVASDVVAATAMSCGFARLAAEAPARWLLAPRGPTIALLLEARKRGVRIPDVLVTTPARFSALVQRTAGAAMAHEASETLPERHPTLSAKNATGTRFRAALTCGVLGVSVLAGFAPETVAAVVGLMFFAAISLRLMLCAAGLAEPEPDPAPLADADLPIYSVLVPLYREAGMVPKLIAHLDRIDYPRSKLDVCILVEADDLETRLACLTARLGPHYAIIIAPNGQPRTKPRALNVALPLLEGTLVTVFDAEDLPDPGQLRRAAARLDAAPPDVACLQARLAIHNGSDSLLSRLFAIEYAALFDLFNLGVARCRVPMALGGTSNHFRGIR